MTFATRRAESDRDQRFLSLTQKKANLTKALQTWVSTATQLHSDSPAEDKAEVIALRDAFIADIRTAFGI